MSSLFDPRVAVSAAAAPYPRKPPFSPPERYPEFPYRADEVWDPDNRVYPALRRLLFALGLDRERFGTPDWNPLGTLVRPGDRVLLKPNWILHQHLSGRDPFSVITHSSVLRAVLDYLWIALGRDPESASRITVADAPQANADWGRLVATTQIGQLLEELGRRHGFRVALKDLRVLRVVQRHGVTVRRERSDAEAVLIDLGRESELAPLGASLANLCGSDYDRHRTVKSHDNGHRYAAARSLLEADVLISVAKLKVHKKTGVSLGLKNMVGINADKNHIPHYRVGDCRSGGDEFPEERSSIGRLRDRLARGLIDLLLGRLDRVTGPVLSSLVGSWAAHRSELPGLDAADAGYNQRVIRLVYQRLLGKPVRAGNWSGNDTLWRAILDLNRIALYGSLEGALLPDPVRRYFSLIDGVVGGEAAGPMDPDPIAAGVLIGGFNPVAVDRVATRFMGFDPDRIPLLVAASRHTGHPLALTADPVAILETGTALLRPFVPPSGWPELAARELEGARVAS